MTPAVRRRVDRLVLALALDEAGGTAGPATLAGEDPEVVAEVRRRLGAAAAVPESFLLAPATEILEAALEEDEPGEPEVPDGDDRYELGECVGVGGMARVHRAFDRQLGRPVALKLIRASATGAGDGPLAEARAQARVRHDHVLDVYETGALGGVPFIALRYVAGGSLAAGPVLEAAGLEQRVRLLAQAAEGLHAAHREGLLHGDVKPSNVLVEEDAEGGLRAWIGDFGVATEAEGPGSERAGLAGTPGFMAPELLAAERPVRDRRSDVYGLGATLYQVLTGEVPPRGGVRRGPRWERASHFPPELAAIVARCMAVDPADRYPSARAVAEDLRRFLDGQVVEAYADRFVYRWTSFARRHRAALAAGAVAALLLAVALTVAAAMGVRAVRANARADQRRSQAEELIGFMLLDLRDKLEAVGSLELLDDVGDRALRYFAAVPEEELSDRELARRSVALYQIGDVRMRRGDLAGAREPLAESLALARRLAARDPGDPERLFGLGQSEFWMGYALWEGGDLAGAAGHLETYLDVSRRLVASDPRNLDWRRELAYAHSNLGSLLQERGDAEEAMARFAAALEIDRRLAAAAPPERRDEERFELAATHNALGSVLEELGRLDAAREHYQADLALRLRLARRQPENRRWQAFLGTSHQFLGNLLAARGELATARAHLETTREVFARLVARDPENREWAYQAAWSELWLGRLLDRLGAAQAAREAWGRAEATAGELVELDAGRADWRRLLAVARYHRARGTAAADPAGALRRVAAAVEHLEPLVDDPRGGRRARRWLAESLLLQGELEADGGDRPAAERSWRRARETLEPLVREGTRAHDVLVPWLHAARLLGREDEAARARAVLDEIGHRGAGEAFAGPRHIANHPTRRER